MFHSVLFDDRAHAGQVLAARLREYAGREDVVVLGLPRGGVPVAAQVARALHAPLDVLLVRKLGVPGHDELAMGAIASGGVLDRNEFVIAQLGVSEEAIRDVVRRELAELERRERVYRHGRDALDLQSKTVIVVDDGLATGSTMRAAITAVRSHGPRRIVAAAPVGSRDTCAQLAQIADQCVCAAQPDPLYAVSLFYRAFAQTSDAEVNASLDSLREHEVSTTGQGAAAQRGAP
jgi:predicted phosphoribosyltransferase